MASVEFALGGYMRARLETWEDGVDTANNTSVVHARIKVWRTNEWGGQTYSSSVTRKIQIGSQVVCDWTGEISHYKSYGEIEVASGQRTVTHNDDGTRTVTVQAWLTDNVSSYFTGSGSLDMGLTTIARASQPSIKTFPNNSPDFEIGDTITIHMNRKSNTFTHTVKINYGSTSTTIATGVTNNCTFNTATIADALYALIPNTNRYANTISVTTYSGGTNVGTKTCNYTAWIKPSQVKPIFSNFTFADTNSTTTAITGNNQVMISGKSTLAVTISAANKATPQKSATITKYTFQAAGLTGEEAYSTSAITKTLGSPTVEASELPSGTRDIVVTAIDSRALSTAATKTVTIVPYSNPKISATATRANGFENSTTVNISGSFSRIEVGGTAKNTVKASNGVQYRYRQQGTSTWGSWTNRAATINTATGKVTTAAFTLNLDNQSAFEFQFRITDKLATTTVNLTVSVGQPAFYIGTDGRVGVGGMPTISKLTGEQGLLEVAGRAFANGHRLLEDDTSTVKGSNIDWSTTPETAYYPGDVAYFRGCQLALTIATSGGDQEYTLPVNKSLNHVTGATVRITSENSENFFRTIEGSGHGFGRPVRGRDYTGYIKEGFINFQANLTDSNGNVSQYATGVGTFGEIRVTFS